jgi:CDP-diacylglycerol--serine O-phosphatidyltransferase
VARLTNTTSKFGVEYDSLSDMVSFGMAPAILSYLWALQDYQRLGWLAAFLYVATTALRLSKFNTMSQNPLVDKAYFSGLPCPAAAGAIATTVLLFNHLEITRKYYDMPIIILIYTLSFLMVSNIKYFSFKKINKFNISNFILMALMMFTFSFVALEPSISLFVIAFSYIISGPLLFIMRIFRKKNQNIVISDETTEGDETKNNA